MPNDSDFLDLAQMRQRYFFPNYQATGSLRNDKQSDSIPPWKASFMICPKWRAYCSRAKFKINTVINIISARWQTKKIFQLTQLWKSINESSFICKDLKFSPFCRIEIKEHALWKSKHTKFVKFNFEKFGGICRWHIFGAAVVGEILCRVEAGFPLYLLN